ncbi:MAG: response regulator [Tetragenococcus koreensis]|nr:response regulator [Tetragenococcus koreensis]
MYKILVVEDEKLIRQRLIFGIDFERLDCVVIGEARDGKEGKELIEKLNPDIVLTDINMPVMDAFDMLEATLDYSYSTIILSGYNEFKNAQKAIKYGVTEFIVKPINEIDIVDAVVRAKTQVDEQNRLMKLETIHELDEKSQLLDHSLETVDDEIVKNMLDFISQNFHKKFLFNDVSKEIGYSSPILHEKFKKVTKMTFNEYLNRYRINQSIQLMKKGEKKLYEIAEACGFSEYKYYNKVFKKYLGVNTTEFMNKL